MGEGGRSSSGDGGSGGMERQLGFGDERGRRRILYGVDDAMNAGGDIHGEECM